MNSPQQPWLIVGQGLAGSCLAWEFFRRGIPFEIVDTGSGGSSRVAAGMVNPITGKNFQPSWRIGDFHPQAMDFYLSLEARLKTFFWYPVPILRLATSEKEWRKISGKLDSPEISPWVQSTDVPTPAGFSGAVELKGGGRLDAPAFMEATRKFFTDYGNHRISRHDTSESHPRRILCEGALGLMAGQLGQHRCAKGEILTVRADWPESHIRVGAGGWLVPTGRGLFLVGSTYGWDELDETPTPAGRLRITEIARRLGGADFEITAHVAGVRPILRRSQPLIGKNSSGDWIFNALGSKGSLYAPGMARMLADWIEKDIRPEEDFILPPV